MIIEDLPIFDFITSFQQYSIIEEVFQIFNRFITKYFSYSFGFSSIITL